MCEVIKVLNCISISVISNQFEFRNIQFKVTYFEALSEGVCLLQACVNIRVAVKNFPELWYSTVIVGHMTTLT